MPALDHPLIDRFLDALWLEKGLSEHTRAAYRSDLALFNGWLAERGLALPAAGREIILDHLAWRLAQVDLPQAQVDQLADPQSAGVEHLEHGSVAQADGVVHIRRGE